MLSLTVLHVIKVVRCLRVVKTSDLLFEGFEFNIRRLKFTGKEC